MTRFFKINCKLFELLKNVFQLSVCFSRVLIPHVGRELPQLLTNSGLGWFVLPVTSRAKENCVLIEM